MFCHYSSDTGERNVGFDGDGDRNRNMDNMRLRRRRIYRAMLMMAIMMTAIDRGGDGTDIRICGPQV